MLFGDAADVRLAWRVLLCSPATAASTTPWWTPSSGTLLYRTSLVHERGTLAFDHYPGAPVGGTQVAKDHPAGVADAPAAACRARTPYVHSDVDDDLYNSGRPDAGDGRRDPADRGHVELHTVDASPAASTLPARRAAAGTATSHPAGRPTASQAGTQLFYFVNNFHDYLRDTPGIEFGASLRQLRGRPTACSAQVDDGADLAGRGRLREPTTPTTPAWPSCPTATRRGCRCTSSRTTAN